MRRFRLPAAHDELGTRNGGSALSSNAYAKFKKTIARCENLADDYTTLHALHVSGGIPAPSKDILRGTVVLAVAALDTYVTDVFAERLVAYLKKYKPDESLVQLLHEAGLDTREALQLITMDRPYRRIANLIRRQYARYTTQRFEVIDELFLNYRLKNITDNAQARSGRRSLKTSVGKLIQRRHDIAHAGDYNSHGRIQEIDEASVKKRITHLEILVTNMDAIICQRI